MKTIAFAQRLLRDLKEKDLASLSADTRLELVDAIAGSIAALHALAPPHSKETTAALTLPAPTVTTLTLTNGSTEFTGFVPTDEDTYCTIRIDGDPADNQILANGTLLFPFSGPTGTASATIYHDACLIPEPVEEIIDDPVNIDYRERLTKDETRQFEMLSTVRLRQKQIRRPEHWWSEANAANQAPGGAPSVFRVDTLPPELIRLQVRVSMGPARISFQSILDGVSVLPVRHEHIELYLLPIARARLASSSMWRQPETRDRVMRDGDKAEAAYSILAPKTLSTPQSRVFTPRGF